MSYSKTDLDKKTVIELRYICKKHKLPLSSKKADLIKNILDHFTVPEPVISTNKTLKVDSGKKIVGVKITDKYKLIEISKQLGNNGNKILYYSIGVIYYLVDEQFNFV